jgi:hypothetical protein
MMSSRGMGAISPSKMPKGKKTARRDDTDFTQYAKGGEVWDKKRPKSLGKPKELTEDRKAQAKSRARRAGRAYPNLIDNMWAAN